jgi:hypothetical protein
MEELIRLELCVLKTLTLRALTNMNMDEFHISDVSCQRTCDIPAVTFTADTSGTGFTD